jgi:hypothetical protein
VWPGYENMGFTQNFVVKTSWKITWKTKVEMAWQYLRKFFGQNSLRKPRREIMLTLKHLAMILYHQHNSQHEPHRVLHFGDVGWLQVLLWLGSFLEALSAVLHSLDKEQLQIFHWLADASRNTSFGRGGRIPVVSFHCLFPESIGSDFPSQDEPHRVFLNTVMYVKII